MITSNHVHVVVDVEDRYAVADMMKLAASVVDHIGRRKRYRIIAQERLFDRTGFAAMSEFSSYYADSIEQALAIGRPERQAWWTESVAVGSDEFIEEAVRTIVHRRSMEKHEIQIPDQESTWIVRE